jgi:hypothetical protein
MAIHTVGELDVVMMDVVLKIERQLSEQPHGNAALAAAVRDMKQLADHLRKGGKPSPQQIKSLLTASSTVRDTVKSDDMYDRMLDIEDYVQTLK